MSNKTTRTVLRPELEGGQEIGAGLAAFDPKRPCAFRGKRVRMIRPGIVGILIANIEYVMPVHEANDLIGMINRARHDGVQNWVDPDDCEEAP